MGIETGSEGGDGRGRAAVEGGRTRWRAASWVAKEEQRLARPACRALRALLAREAVSVMAVRSARASLPPKEAVSVIREVLAARASATAVGMRCFQTTMKRLSFVHYPPMRQRHLQGSGQAGRARPLTRGGCPWTGGME